MKTKVSVVIPVYNSEKYIEKCIDSVLSQSFQNFELIVINDGSKDRSQEILENYKKKNPDKINLINQENMGVSKTRNKAIKLANGEYIMFIDNDDFIDKDYIETFVNHAEKGDYDVVLGGYRRPDKNGKIIKEQQLSDEEWSKFMIFAPWAKIYKKDYLIKNEIEFLPVNIGEDVYFNIQAMLSSDKIKIVDYIGYNWFYNEKSVSNTTQKNIKNLQVYELLNSCYDILNKKNILDKNYQIIEMYFIRYIVWFLTFSTKKVGTKIIKEEYDKIFEWLENKFPNYQKNKLLGISKPKGELFSIRLMVSGFMFAHKIKLGKTLLIAYSKI
ncbi:MAG: glycosyltransferase [Clostridia bacterium]|nr:glycosyltransferase [Clostridia bacterium]